MCVFSPPFMYSTSIPFLDATVSSSDLSFLTLANQIVISTGCQGWGRFDEAPKKKKKSFVHVRTLIAPVYFRYVPALTFWTCDLFNPFFMSLAS